MPNMDRQPMMLRKSAINPSSTYHHYDENVAERETFATTSAGLTPTIRYYVPKHFQRPTRWQVGVIVSDANDDRWAGGVTVFRGLWNAYVRGPDNTSLRYEMCGFDNRADAIDALRWAIQRIYP